MIKRISLTVALLFIAAFTLSACQGGTTPVAPIEQSDLQTLVAGTLTAAAVEMQQTMTAAVTPTETIAPTLTETATLPPTDTPTKEVVSITLSGNTNCRRGASTYFPVITVIPAGSVVEVIARNPESDYFFVRAAESDTGGCWIWKEFASVTGNLESLAVYTPVPTPLPTATNTPPPGANFTAQFAGITACETGYGAHFNITNTGSSTLQSIRIKIGSLLSFNFNDFAQWSHGGRLDPLAELTSGKSMIVTTCVKGKEGPFDTIPSGQIISAEITVCLNDNLTGACSTQSLEFKPD